VRIQLREIGPGLWDKRGKDSQITIKREIVETLI
jgi:hypothetical protein